MIAATGGAITARGAPSLGSPARTVPPILWPCGAILLGNAIGPERHHAWAMLALLAGALLLLALVTRMSAVWLAAVMIGALAATLWHLTAAPPSTIVWPNEATNAIRGTVETWPQEQGERVRGTIVVFAARTDHGWQPAHATLRTTLPSYPVVERGDVVVVGGAALIRQGWWRDADGSLYAQWARVEQRSDAETAADVRHNVVGRFTTGIKRHVRFPESGLTVGMIFGETSTIDGRTRDALNATGTTQHGVITQWMRTCLPHLAMDERRSGGCGLSDRV